MKVPLPLPLIFPLRENPEKSKRSGAKQLASSVLHNEKARKGFSTTTITSASVSSKCNLIESESKKALITLDMISI